jgi:hypothetical protein
VPARLEGYVCRCGARLRGLNGSLQCPACGEVFGLDADGALRSLAAASQ